MSNIDLQSFCATPDDDHRSWLHAPFSYEDFTYATNGHILVRVPASDARATPTDFKKFGPRVTGFFKAMDAAAFVSPLPISLPPDEETSEQVECESCDGRGHEHECPDCACKCLDCGGTGRVTNVEKISTVFFGKIYRLKYVRQIVALPGIEIAPASANPEQSQPLLFRFDGGQGCVMARTSPCKNHIECAVTSGIRT